MTSIEGKAVERIGNAIVELEHVISSLQHAAIGRRASLLEPDNPNGLEPTLRIYSFAFRHPDCPKMLPEEGLSVMSKLKDCWDRFFNGLTSICDNRELCRKAEDAQHDVHLAATNALLGKHAENETTLLENFRNVLTSIAGDVADKDQKFPKYDSEGRPLVAVDAITKKGETALDKALSSFMAKIKNVLKLVKNISNIVMGDHTWPHERSAINQNLVTKALNGYWELVNKGTDQRDATTMACKKVWDKEGHGTYKTFESFRDAVNTEIRKNEHCIPGVET